MPPNIDSMTWGSATSPDLASVSGFVDLELREPSGPYSVDGFEDSSSAGGRGGREGARHPKLLLFI